MKSLFPNQDFGRIVLKHRELPVYKTDEFVFLGVFVLVIVFMVKR